MKKILCLLLAMMMLMLVSCQETNDESTDKSAVSEESAPEITTPWSELKALLESVDPMVKMPDAFQNMMGMSENISGTGTYSVAMSMSGLSGGDSETKSGTVTMDGPVVKMESTVDILGIQVPMITWTDGNVSYIQYPTLYPDKVFNSEDISSSGAGSVPSMSGMDIAALPDQMISILEEVADPHKDMTVSETDGTFTYTLVMDAEAGGKLFDKIDAILVESGTSDILGSGGDILGQLGGSGETAEKEEVAFDSAVFTVTTDKFATLNYSLQKLQGDTTVESIRLDTLATETSLTYTIEKKIGDTVDTALTVAVSETAVTMKGDITADAATKVKIDLTVTCTEETTIALDGTLNVEMSQGGLSLSIPLDISGTVSVTDEKMTMEIGVTMEMMGMGMNAEMNYDITFGDITLEIPFDEDDVMEYDEEAFAEKLMEVYPELFEPSGNYFVSDDGSVAVAVTSDKEGLLICDGTYEKNGNALTITFPGEFTLEGNLTQSGDIWYWNGRSVDVRDLEGIINVAYIVNEAQYWSLFLFEDGTCSITTSYLIVSMDNEVLLATDNVIPIDDFRFVNETTILFYDIKLINN